MHFSNLLTYGNLLDPDVLRMALVLGVVASALIYDRFHLSTGSVVVPCYLGTSILHPSLIFLSLVSAGLVYWVIYRLLPNYLLMGARSKFLAAIAASAGMQFLFLHISGLSSLYLVGIPLLGTIGFIAPGLIAHDFARHGVARTLVVTVGAGLIVALVVGLTIVLLGNATFPNVIPEYPPLTFGIEWIGYSLILSVLASIGLQYNYGVRTGGFVGAGYLSIMVVSPLDVVYVLVLSFITYLLVARILMKHGFILFGRRKFASMMLCSVMLSWGGLLVIERGIGYAGLIASFFPLAGAFLPGLFANDMERVGIAKVVMGTALVVVFTLVTTFLLREIAGDRNAQFMLILAILAGFTSALIFARTLPRRLAGLVAQSLSITIRYG